MREVSRLKPHPRFQGRPGGVLLVIMDGIGIGARDEGDAVYLARTPTLDGLLSSSAVQTQLRAHGTAVGMPSDQDMGNSEIGHNALGCGRVFDQGAKLVNRAFASKEIYQSKTWTGLVAPCIADRTALHLIGLLSDGNVHSHIDHLFALIREADRIGIEQLYVHALLDGRDVGETTALEYIRPTEQLLSQVNQKPSRRYRIASGGGRMLVTMDRYNADWSVVKRGWDAHVLGRGRRFSSAEEAVVTYREEIPGIDDQNTPEFVIWEGEKPVATIDDGDSVIFYNFRGDRAIEISRAFEEADFEEFDRERLPNVQYAGMMQYDGDLKVPKTYLVSPPAIDRTLGEFLAASSVTQLAISETQKYGHVTYFWNGNRSGKFDDSTETYVEIPSDRVEFNKRPWMKVAEITERVLQELASGNHRFLRLNYANGDMVGHTGDLEAAILAVQAVDLCLGRLIGSAAARDVITVVTADHGNADEMFMGDKRGAALIDEETGKPKPKTSHTLNPVPFYVYDPLYEGEYELQPVDGPGLSNVTATLLNLLGFEAPEDYDPSLITFK